MDVLVTIALALGITFSTGPEQIPTSLCYDPLLGPTAIIYTDCGGAQAESNKERPNKQAQSAEQPTEQPIEEPAEQLVAQSPEQQTEQSIEQPSEQSTENPKPEKEKCNKGSGNGGEGCDPGNHPEKGNNDEGGDRHPQNDNPDKTKQKCNKGSGNGGEGCDPGNHPEKGNNDEGGDRHPENSKKNKEN